MVEGDMLAIIFFSVLFGISIAAIGEKGKPVFRGKTMMVLVQKSFIGASLMHFPMVSPDAGFFGVPSSQIQAFLI